MVNCQRPSPKKLDSTAISIILLFVCGQPLSTVTKITARLWLSLSNNYLLVVNHRRLSLKIEDSIKAITLILLSGCVQQLKIFNRHYYAKRRFITYHHPSLSHHRPIVIRTCQKNVRLEKAHSTPGYFFADIVSL